MQYEKCYTFEPTDRRPAKRRKIEPQGLQRSWGTRRYAAYEQEWQRVKRRIDQSLHATNLTTIEELQDFLDNPSTELSAGRIPTAIISAGPNAASQQAIVHQLKAKASADGRRLFVSLSAASASNLKAALKFIISKGTSQAAGIDEDEDIQPQAAGPRLLNYDLQILANHVRERELEHVVLSIEDTEAFNSDLLSELIEVLGCWHDRIPFIFLLSIATSLDFLEQRLSKDAVQYLEGKEFSGPPAGDEINRVTESITDSEIALWIGPNLMSMLLERQVDFVQNVESFVQAIQYAYMSCFYANPLSIFLDDAISFDQIPKDHFQAVRNAASFRELCQQYFDDSKYEVVQELLDSDQALWDEVRRRLESGRQALDSISGAITVIHKLQLCIQGSQASTQAKLYLQAMSGKLHKSSPLRAMLLSMRKAPSNQAIDVMKVLSTSDAPGAMKEQFEGIHDDLRELLHRQANTDQPLRSEDDVKNSTMRTTVVAQRIELSKQKSALSEEDAAYTKILRRFTDLLEEYFEDVLLDPKTLAFHEIFLYDLKSPHRETLTPRPRHAIERALAAPNDYLVCDCCAPRQDEGDDTTLASTQPATAILYQLYLESGNLINASDLWQAFRAVIGDEKDEDDSMALFQRALAELRYLGMVKSTRKRVDHVAKIAWRGL